MSTARVFVDEPAVRREVPLLVGLVGPSGSGKTYSALRLATGMQKVAGGSKFVIDTEASRACHYAEQFKFRHVPFTAPFGPLDYQAAVEHCAKQGAKTIIIDSASHLHEGPGGTLEVHEAECERLLEAWHSTREKIQMSAWQKPKAELRRFLNAILQLRVNLIFCFRAKEKLKVIPGKPPVALGFMPIAGDEMIYEMTLNCLLPPNSGGVPSWQPEELGERAIVKLPGQFRGMFEKRAPLDEATGEALAKWAAGGAAPSVSASAPEEPASRRGEVRRDEVLKRLANVGVDQARALAAIKRARVEEITEVDVTALIALGTGLKTGAMTLDQAFPPIGEREPGSDG